MEDLRERETLLDRSKRIMGEQFEMIEDPFPFGIERQRPESPKPGGVSTKSNAKRREQVLQAQRKHRQRTQTYLKMLEKEVIRLREREAAALSRVNVLQQHVDVLIQTLRKSGISVPPPSDESAPGRPLDAAPELIPDREDPSAELVQVAFPKSLNSIPPVGTLTHQWQSNERIASDPVATAAVPFSAAESRLNTNDSIPFSIQDPRVGIHFVLALERPCMNHTHGTHLEQATRDIEDEENKVSGHVFTASLSLWQSSSPGNFRPTSCEVSLADIERLLCTSLDLGLYTCEITPVQIWNHLRSLCHLSGSDARAMLDMLIKELSEHVVCLHFGAVIDRVSAEAILDRHIQLFQPNAVTSIATSE